ncbi:E1B 55K [Bovine atadenovirus D]|uniref:E1B 55K n=1 Tax=Bovine adenovirus 4 TaxID=70333 RepID=Q997I6_ADEB4|nr:E1B 55K [Bovine atadenovirus D]AAK13172.1 E1B 55K [Bovine adenovirus 4]
MECLSSADCPFVSNPIVTWPQAVHQNVAPSTARSHILLPVDADPEVYFNKYSAVYLIPDATYTWKNVEITTHIHIYGQGATVKLHGSGPILSIRNAQIEPKVLRVLISDIHFIGGELPNRNSSMGSDCLHHGAIFCHNVWKTTISNCVFENFKGAAVWYSSVPYSNFRKWGQQHCITSCKFDSCRIGVANTSYSEFSMANNNHFFDCQVCFNVVGGYWMRNDNLFVQCRCAYLHTKKHMWYSGDGQNFQAARGTFNNNMLNHCDYGSMWPTEFVLANGSVIELAGFYFDDDEEQPPTFVGNMLWYGDVKILKLPMARLKHWCINACHIYGITYGMPDAGCITISPELADIVFVIGCSGNNVVIYNVNEEHIVPSVGIVKQKNLQHA